MTYVCVVCQNELQYYTLFLNYAESAEDLVSIRPVQDAGDMEAAEGPLLSEDNHVIDGDKLNGKMQLFYQAETRNRPKVNQNFFELGL